MQSTPARQQLTTCPQCDNVVRVDADFCNICGQQLRPMANKSEQLIQAHSSRFVQNDEEDEYEDDEYEDERASTNSLVPLTAPVPTAPTEILTLLHHLQDESASIETYFPANLPNKAQKLTVWKKQIQRVLACVELFERPQLQQIDSQQALKLRHHLAEATHALDFTREYTVKLIGHAGAGKSTLLAALVGRDIFPRLAGGAVTGVCTHVRLCKENENEEMRVHFMTRTAFDETLKRTQQSIQNTTSQKLRASLATELSFLLKASETFGEQYLKEQEPHIEIIPRERWKEESSRYIEEPARDNEEPRLIRLIEYVEYNVRTGTHSLLPSGSVLVDLPGGSAGQVHHDMLLRDELNTVDAVILVVGNNRFGDDDRTERIFEIVRRRVVQGRAPEVAARMVFLAVTHWDEINSPASTEKALGSLRPLLRMLPANYSSYHHHGAGNPSFFYPSTWT